MMQDVERGTTAGVSRSFLEDYLYYVSLLDEPTLNDAAMAAVHRVLERVKHTRRCHRAGRPRRSRGAVTTGPCTATTSAPSDALGAGHTDDDDTVLQCLTDACLSTTLAPALALVQAAYDHRPAHTGVAATLLTGALAELRWRAFLQQTPSPCAETAKLLSLLDDAVREGHVGAMLAVGQCLREGYAAVPIDLAAAVTWMERAAHAGFVPAMCELAELYERGASSATHVIDADWAEAARWYGRAAHKACYVPAQLNLGKLLLLAAAVEMEGGAEVSAAERRTLRARGEEWVEVAALGGSAEAVRLRQHFARSPAATPAGAA